MKDSREEVKRSGSVDQIKSSRRTTTARRVEKKVNTCRTELAAMRIFAADSTASAKLTKIAFLKLYNKMQV